MPKIGKLETRRRKERKAIRKLAEAISPDRAELVSALKYADDQPEFQFLIRALADPRNKKKAITTLCKEANVGYFKFLRLVSESKRSAAILDAMDSISKRVPILADDIMENALNRQVECNSCNGTGAVQKVTVGTEVAPQIPMPPLPCSRCSGTGKIILMADIDRQKLAADISGLIKKDSSKTAVNVNVNQLSDAGNTPAFRSNTDKWLAEAIPAQLVETAPVEKPNES